MTSRLSPKKPQKRSFQNYFTNHQVLKKQSPNTEQSLELVSTGLVIFALFSSLTIFLAPEQKVELNQIKPSASFNFVGFF